MARKNRTKGQIASDIQTQSKVCGTCGYRKDFELFHENKTTCDGRGSSCISCVKLRTQNLDKASSYFRQIKSVYGVSIDEYIQMAIRQGNRCALCGEETHQRLQVDHCHTTGKVRGLLCGKCNKGLGLFHDDEATLQRAIEYLKESKE